MALGIFELDLLKDVSDDAFVVKGATVTVYIEGGGLATLYDDITQTTGPTNPFTISSTESTIEFYADQDNRYRIEIVSGALSRILRYRSVSTNVQIIKDYADTAVSTHSAEVDNVHGIDSGDAVESVSGAQAKADAVSTNLTTHIDSATPHPNLTLDFEHITWPTAYQIGTPTHIDTLQESVSHLWSAGVVHGCEITDNGDGTVSIDSGYALLHATADSHTPLYTASIAAQGPIALTDQSENYIYVDYNAGAPIFSVSTTSSAFNCIDKCLAYYIYRNGTALNIIEAKEQNVDSNRKSRRLFLEFQKFIHGYEGTQLGGSGLALTVTEGTFYYMIERLPHPAFDTTVAGTANENVFSLWYRDGVGGWTETVDQKTISSTVYDNNTGTPVALSNNKYGVSWVYIVNNSPSTLHVVMGQGDYNTQSEAEAATHPFLLPGAIGAHGSLIGFVVYLKSAISFVNVLSAFARAFTASAATNHNGLAGLQGGTTSQYYHFTSAQYTAYGYHTRARNTTAPNATVPVHSFTAAGAETNIDIALSPKGTGAIVAQVPDGTATGGNKRGTYAVDWQIVRASATDVASGSWSVICGGEDNKSTQAHTVVCGGDSNEATSSGACILGGTNNSASSAASVVVGGTANTASGSGAAVVGGNVNQATATYAFIANGSNNLADGIYSYIPGGVQARVRGIYGRMSFASGSFNTVGDAQIGSNVLRQSTTDATASMLSADGSATPSTTNVPVLPDDHAYAITARVIGRDTSTGDVYHIIAEGTAYRGTGAATVALSGTPVYTTISQSAGAAAWAVALVVNTTRGSAEIQVTGEAAKTIHWVCKFDTVEVG